ncbi:hypothetical protein G6O67_008570 [Ophiocordyceps sinensis]|uniref:Uncharacterized protein n=1 Tax=Ophiocordyceps sinensis TaxID=72228 RepID=A0A8H4LS42_9HYPO|nr:hypothetical protein G6O67_008570 [Ophiocordyceps sinensis]
MTSLSLPARLRFPTSRPTSIQADLSMFFLKFHLFNWYSSCAFLYALSTQQTNERGCYPRSIQPKPANLADEFLEGHIVDEIEATDGGLVAEPLVLGRLRTRRWHGWLLEAVEWRVGEGVEMVEVR